MSNGNPIIIVKDNGNVGIGKEPQENTKLDVDGEINAKNFLRNGEPLLPIGSIIAWHRDLLGENVSVPFGWALCDGQTVEDPDSPLNGLQIPDLNGEGRFLRGSTSSGKDQDDAFQGHFHHVNYDGGQKVGSTYQRWVSQDNNGVPGGSSFPSAAIFHATEPAKGKNGTPRIANETRPSNMSVVWIMKIK